MNHECFSMVLAGCAATYAITVCQSVASVLRTYIQYYRLQYPSFSLKAETKAVYWYIRTRYLLLYVEQSCKLANHIFSMGFCAFESLTANGGYSMKILF
jgi:hypothetical protein